MHWEKNKKILPLLGIFILAFLSNHYNMLDFSRGFVLQKLVLSIFITSCLLAIVLVPVLNKRKKAKAIGMKEIDESAEVDIRNLTLLIRDHLERSGYKVVGVIKEKEQFIASEAQEGSEEKTVVQVQSGKVTLLSLEAVLETKEREGTEHALIVTLNNEMQMRAANTAQREGVEIWSREKLIDILYEAKRREKPLKVS